MAIIIIVVFALLVGGVAVWQYIKIPTKTELPEIGTPPEKVVDETADWKIYRNEKYGYGIKYPNDWDSPIELGDTDALTGNDSAFLNRRNILLAFSIFVRENDKNLSLKEWWEQEFYEKFTVKYEYSYEGVVSVSSGVEAVKYKIQRMGFEDNCYLISRNQRVYTIYFSVLPGAEEIQKILSTFRFLD